MDGTSGSSLDMVPVTIGDVIYVAIDPKNGDMNYDSTGVTLTINATNISTPTPTATFTPTSTPTDTPTPTITYTPTVTFTPTITFTPTNTSTPNHGGNGTCWQSGPSWEGHTVYYYIERDTIPVSKGWDSSIHGAAQAWNDVVPSSFQFIFSEDRDSSNAFIEIGEPLNQYSLAEAHVPADENHHILGALMVINPEPIGPDSVVLDWDTNNSPSEDNPDSNGSTTTFNLQNTLTHEFGHWLKLEDIMDFNNCSQVTMFQYTDPGDLSDITLQMADIEAINWQYP